MSQEPIDENPVSVEEILRSVDPAASSLDLPRVMYLAGRASATAAARRPAGRTGWIWPAATAASLLLAAAFALAWTFSGDHEVVERIVVERIVYVEKEPPPPVAKEPIDVSPAPEPPNNPWHEYARHRQIVLSQGLEGLPEPDWRPISDPGSLPWDPVHEAAEKPFGASGPSHLKRRAPGGEPGA